MCSHNLWFFGEPSVDSWYLVCILKPREDLWYEKHSFPVRKLHDPEIGLVAEISSNVKTKPGHSVYFIGVNGLGGLAYIWL